MYLLEALFCSFLFILLYMILVVEWWCSHIMSSELSPLFLFLVGILESSYDFYPKFNGIHKWNIWGLVHPFFFFLSVINYWSLSLIEKDLFILQISPMWVFMIYLVSNWPISIIKFVGIDFFLIFIYYYFISQPISSDDLYVILILIKYSPLVFFVTLARMSSILSIISKPILVSLTSSIVFLLTISFISNFYYFFLLLA